MVHQNAEREARRPLGRVPQARSFLRAAREAREENVRAKRADFLSLNLTLLCNFNANQYQIETTSSGIGILL